MIRRSAVLVQVWGWASLVLAVGGLAGVLGALLYQVSPAIGPWLGQALAGSVPTLALALVIAAPVSLGTAVALDQVLPPGRLLHNLRLFVAGLDGLPAIVIGVVGALLLSGSGIAAPSVVLSLAIAPALTVDLQRILRRAEPEERMAAVALGATPLQVLLYVVGPASARGIGASLLRTCGRMIGLAAPLLLLQGTEPLPIAWHLFDRASSGDLAAAAVLALVVLALGIVCRALAMVLDRPADWRLP